MDLHGLQSLFSTLWVVWFFILFAGIILFVMRPGKRGHYERLGTIPLRDDAPRSQRR
jgi:cbb3-type cytochrome oxidase subunit 3